MEKGFPNMAKLAIAKKAITKKAALKKTIAKKATLKKTIGEKAIAQNVKPDQKAQVKRTEEPTEIDIIGGLISN